jgi:polysaccharide export outer membrane protein
MHSSIRILILLPALALGQQTAAPQPAPAAAPVAGAAASSSSIIGIDDILSINVLHGEEFNRLWRVNGEGSVRLPFIGAVKAAGLTVDQLEADLTRKLAKYFNEPQVTVTLTETRSQPVTVLGAVDKPGAIQLQGRNTLFHVLNSAGGPKDAGSTVTITRDAATGPLEIEQARPTSDGRYYVAEVPIDDVLSGRGPAASLEVKTNDVINVAPKQPRLVYIIGEVLKPGTVELVKADTVSITKVVAAAGGFSRLASEKKSLIRRIGGEPGEMAIIDLEKIMKGEAADLELGEGDVLMVPSNQFMSYLQTVSLTAVNAGVFSGLQVLARF